MLSSVYPLSIAPMIDWTYTHFRVFMRLLLPHALLYTEMQTPGAITHNPQRALGFSAMEQPLALQLGGSDPDALAQCAKAAEVRGFCEVNINLGCPSPRVQSGRFGACLMAEPRLVAQCIAAMKAAVSIPVTIKTRIGIDHQDSFSFFHDFVASCVAAGADKVIVHARKAWLSGLNPKQNRTIPPIQYEYVTRLQQCMPDVPIVLNGNIQDVDTVKEYSSCGLQGVMIGRLACDNPYALTAMHQYFYPDTPILSQCAVFMAYIAYAQQQYRCQGVPFSLLLKPLYTLLHGTPYSKKWKQGLMHMQQGTRWDLAALERLEGIARMTDVPW